MFKRLDRRQQTSHLIFGDIIPRLVTLRRVPTRYRRVLPLSLMKRYQCIVVGEEAGILTVAITNQANVELFQMLSQLTGCLIFPVLIDPARMHLLIRRIERAQQEGLKNLYKTSSGYILDLHAMLIFLTKRIS